MNKSRTSCQRPFSPLALALVAEGRTRVVGEVVEIEGATAPGGLFVNPAPGE